MSLISAVILGIVQGLTEFIPVSSSGHLVLAHKLLGGNTGGLAFDVALHIGTLLALVCFFYKAIIKLAADLFLGLVGLARSGGSAELRESNIEKIKLPLMLIVASVPAAVTGVLLGDVSDEYFRSAVPVAFGLLIFAILMIVAENYAAKHQRTDSVEKVSWKQGIVVGAVQSLAVVFPGVSRSGSTITTGLFMGLSRSTAARYSFLLAIPITAGAIAKVMASDGLQLLASQKSASAIGILTAFLSGIIAIKYLLKYLSTRSLKVFAYYRIGLAVLVLLFAR